jgi:hypothetical protein
LAVSIEGVTSDRGAFFVACSYKNNPYHTPTGRIESTTASHC